MLRNPKDVIVSYFKFFSKFLPNQFMGTLDEMVDLFVEGNTMYGPWWEHLNTYTSLANVHIVHYEDLVQVYKIFEWPKLQIYWFNFKFFLDY